MKHFRMFAILFSNGHLFWQMFSEIRQLKIFDENFSELFWQFFRKSKDQNLLDYKIS